MKSNLSTLKLARLSLAALLAAGVVLPGPFAGSSRRALAQPAPATSPAAPGTADLPLRGGAAAELKGRKVEDVRVLGNTQVSTGVIRNVIRTHEGDPFDPATVEEDYQRVYALKRFGNVEARVEPTATGVVVVFTITEQRQVASIIFKGNRRIETQTLRDAIDLRSGESIDPFRLSLARQAVEKLYRTKNFPFARVDVSQDALAQRGDVVFTVTEGPNVRVRRVQVLGNHSYSDDKLKDQIKTRHWIFVIRAGTYDEEQIDYDVASLRRFYEDHGFFDVRVGRKITWSPDQTEAMVTFLVDEGKRYVVEHVAFKGNGRVKDAGLRAELKLVEGRPYDLDLVRRDVRQMTKAYSKYGLIYQPQSTNPDYLRIEPKTNFKREAGKVDLVYEISEGNEYSVGRFVIRGNTKIHDKVFLREMRVQPGQKYNSYELAQAVDRIKNTRLVNSVTLTPIGDDPKVRDVLVEVNETQTAFFQIGAGVTSSAGILGNISYEQRNFDITNVPSSLRELFSTKAFTGAGQYFRIELEPGTEQSRARITFREPWLFDQPYSFGSDVYYSTRQREHYDESRAGGRFSLGKRFTPQISGQVTLRGEDVGISSITNKPQRAFEILDLKGHSTITSAGIDLRRDTTDSPIFPGRGTNIDLSYEYAGAFGGDFHFHKLQADYALYQTIREDLLDRKTTITYRVSAGYISGNSPFFEEFYAGGLGSVRGFRFRGISPRSGIDNDPVGGKFSVTGSVELNYPIAGEGFRGVLFVDAGDVEREARFGTIRTAAGFGFRITLPIFGQLPLAVDFGVPITKARFDDTRILSFALGFGR